MNFSWGKLDLCVQILAFTEIITEEDTTTMMTTTGSTKENATRSNNSTGTSILGEELK